MGTIDLLLLEVLKGYAEGRITEAEYIAAVTWLRAKDERTPEERSRL